MMRSFLLISAAAAVLFCTSCSMLIRQDPPPPQHQHKGKPPKPEAGKKPGEKKGGRTLSDREIAEMSPDELERYMEEKRRKERAQAFSDDIASGSKLSESDRRRMRENVSRPMTPEERGSAFPWKSEPGSRSESLRDTRTFRH